MKQSQFFTDTSSLNLVESDCWKLLTKACSDAKSDFKLPVLASASADGVSQRIVVLRSVDAEAGSLLIHTDVRSAKIQQLQQNPIASLLFYDKAKKVQLKATAVATIHTDDAIADQLWQSESATSIKCYLGPLAPGAICSEPEHNLHPEFVASIPDRSQLEVARPNFAAVRFVVKQLDWLQLNRSGNLHAQFTYADDRSMDGTWTAP